MKQGWRRERGGGEGERGAGGKLSQEEVTLMTAVRSGDSGDRGGC